MTIKYAKDKNTLILVSLLKSHGIKKVIVSPGTTNISFVLTVQNDPWFEVYSFVDERAAAFAACGLADASGEPVVLSCTGATASRNYLPGLTEAYYRKLPILAITSSLSLLKSESYTPQYIDRKNQFSDLVKLSIQAPTVFNKQEENNLISQINRAILELTHKDKGPVHINLWFNFSGKFVDELPHIRTIKKYYINSPFPNIKGKKIGIFIGSHEPFSADEIIAIDKFCLNHNSIVLCDQTSNYRGSFRFLANLSNQQEKTLSSKTFDLIIHLGSVSGSYLPFDAKEVWRVNPDGEVRDCYGKMTAVFEMEELQFFNSFASTNNTQTELIDQCNSERAQILASLPELPFSNIWIAQQTEHLIPNGSVIHFAILNSLRAWNFFETKDNVSCFSNTGGFGIDGCLSSLLGAAYQNYEKEYFGILGDLSFFYDINSLTNKIPPNVHLLVINNGVGTEFKNYSHIASLFGESADAYIAAKGHNGYKSDSLLKTFSTNCGFIYYSASNKSEFLLVQKEWLSKHDKPVVCEVFVDDYNESKALYLTNHVFKRKFKKLKSLLSKVPLLNKIFGKLARR